MDNNRSLLKKSIESIRMIQSEMHDVMDSRTRAELDKVVADLEKCGKDKSSTQLLEILGKVIILIPAVEKLLKAFFDL